MIEQRRRPTGLQPQPPGCGVAEQRISDNYGDSLVNGRSCPATYSSDIDEHVAVLCAQISLMASAADNAISFRQTNRPIQMSSRTGRCSAGFTPLLISVTDSYAQVNYSFHTRQ